MRRSVVFVESNTTGTGALMLQAATRLGFESVLLASDPGRYRLNNAETVVSLDTSSYGSIVHWCKAQTQRRVYGVTSSSEYFVETAARVAEALNLRGPNSAAVRAARSKFTQRVRLRSASLRCPYFVHLRPGDNFRQKIAPLSLPVVVKPCFGSGSVGVRRCSDWESAIGHVESLLAARTNERGITQPQEVLVEEQIGGDEYSIEVVASRVIGVTRKHLGPVPHFVEVGHDYPASLSSSDEQALRHTALEALCALDLEGAAHVEAKLEAGAATIVEVNPRLAGGYIPEIVRLASGIDLLGAFVQWIVGQNPDLTPTRASAASIRFCLATEAGTLQSVEGHEVAVAVPHIHEIRMYKSVGDAVAPCGDFRDRIGHVIAVGPASADTAVSAQAALSLLRVGIAAQCVA
jgi:biotin carboxylase